MHLVIARHQAGDSPEQIVALTGTPKHTVAEYIAAYERGRALDSATSLHGRSLATSDLCVLHGALAE